MMKIKNDAVYEDRVFYLRAADGAMVRRTVNYLLVDKGYHKVNTTENGWNLSVIVTVFGAARTSFWVLLARAVGRVLAYYVSIENMRQNVRFRSDRSTTFVVDAGFVYSLK